MQISNNYNAQSFKRLDYSKVYGDGLKVVKKELPQLEELGKKYDIKLSSSFDALADEELIDVFVHKMNEKFSFIRKLFSYRGCGEFRIGNKCETIADVVNKAIATLK